MKKIIFILVLTLTTNALTAQEEKTSSAELLLQVSTLPEIKLGLTDRHSYPFLQGESPLTEDNNITLAVTREISPISINGIFEAVWTPIAFFQLTAGGRLGTGWNIELFGSNVYGIGLNKSGNDGKAKISGSAFDGLLWKMQMGTVFQFDLAAIFPGDWNHIIARTYHEINYKGYTRAKRNQAWYFENDDGENCNGFNYYGNFLIGYQMPIILNLAALLAEMDLYLYDTPGRSNWGDDLIRWTFSGIFNLAVSRQIDITMIAQFRTRRNFLESDWKDLYYRNRTINSSDPLRLEFYRVAAALTYKF
jgi:hypothetical protein